MGRSMGGRGSLGAATALWFCSLATLAQEPGRVLGEWEISSGLAGFAGPLRDGDHFGQAVAALGDLDGDGVGDLAVGAPDDEGGGRDRGAVWILFLARDGSVRGQQRISRAAGGFPGLLNDFDRFGIALAALGDLDGDGLSELAVGASGSDDGGLERGALWVLFLGRDGAVRQAQKVSHLAGGGVPLHNVDRFGSSLAALGDLDGDGSSELAVGAIGDDDGGANRGAVWVLGLNPDGTVKSRAKISSTQGGFGGALDSDDRFGVAVARVADLDGDGWDELAVGVDQDDDAGANSGAAWILFLGPGATVRSQAKLGGPAGLALESLDRFGQALVSPGDLDGDEIADLVVGATGDDDGGTNRGAVWVLFLARDGGLGGARKISSSAGGLVGPLTNADFFGVGLGALGDHDGDGMLDIAVGAVGDDSGGTERGALRLLFPESVRPPKVTIRNGSGRNPVLLSAEEAPATGTCWEVTVDCSGRKAGVVLHVVSTEPRSGPLLRHGELLIDWTGPRLARGLARHRGTVVTIRNHIPADTALVGQTVHSQAFVTGHRGPVFTNALEAEVVPGETQRSGRSPSSGRR